MKARQPFQRGEQAHSMQVQLLEGTQIFWNRKKKKKKVPLHIKLVTEPTHYPHFKKQRCFCHYLKWQEPHWVLLRYWKIDQFPLLIGTLADLRPSEATPKIHASLLCALQDLLWSVGSVSLWKLDRFVTFEICSTWEEQVARDDILGR